MTAGFPAMEAGGLKEMYAAPTKSLAEVMVGAPGTVAAETGFTGVDGAEATPLPMAFVATMVKVYEVPFVRPLTVIGEDVPVAVCPPDEVTV